jgi:hypothetical protein
VREDMMALRECKDIKGLEHREVTELRDIRV